MQLAAPTPGAVILDATVGLGGHAAALLTAAGPTGQLIGFDADQRNLDLARENLRAFPGITLHNANFREISTLVPENSIDIALFDLGISSLHLDEASRGFAFRLDGPLDMRLDTRGPLTASHIINHWDEEKLADIFYQYGEIRSSRLLAKEIIATRQITPITTTRQLANLIEKISGRILSNTFQALRITVNDEFGALTAGLLAAEKVLRPGGRLIVISFHSLEDRIVKNFFRDHKRTTLEILTKKPITPSATEVTANPRSRSAKVRAGIKASKVADKMLHKIKRKKG